MRIGLGILQDEFELSGEYQLFLGWQEAVRAGGLSMVAFGPAGAPRASGYARHPSGELLWRKALDQWSFAAQALRLAAEVDALHLFLPAPGFLWIADRVKRRCAKPVIVTCLAELPEQSAARWSQLILRAPRFHLVRWLMAALLPAGRFSCDRYLAGTSFLGSQLRRRGCPEDRLLILAGLPPAEAEPDRSSRELAAWMGQRPTFLYIGHFLASKGVEALLDALALVPQARLMLAWSGLGDRRLVEERIVRLGLAGRVRVHEGPVHRSALCAQAAALVAPFPVSYGQTSPPMVVLEAFRAGVPLLASSISSLGELLIEGRTGWRVDPEDAAGMAWRMRSLLDDPKGAERMRAAQRGVFAEFRARLDPAALYG